MDDRQWRLYRTNLMQLLSRVHDCRKPSGPPCRRCVTDAEQLIAARTSTGPKAS